MEEEACDILHNAMKHEEPPLPQLVRNVPLLPDTLYWFIQRWQVKVTCRAVRDHLGVETQRP